MRKEQKIVAAGAASGVATMALGVWILTGTLPVPVVDDDGRGIDRALEDVRLHVEERHPLEPAEVLDLDHLEIDLEKLEQAAQFACGSKQVDAHGGFGRSLL